MLYDVENKDKELTLVNASIGKALSVSEKLRLWSNRNKKEEKLLFIFTDLIVKNPLPKQRKAALLVLHSDFALKHFYVFIQQNKLIKFMNGEGLPL